MKFSILLQNYDPENRLKEMVKDCLHGIVSNSTGHDYELIILDRKGLQSDINRGFSQARGEYLILIANDCIIEDPAWLDKMAVPNTITGWIETKNDWYQGVDFSAAFCMPKAVQEKIGFIDEEFTGYGYADDDYFFRARKLGIPFQVVPVKLEHLQAQTFKAYNFSLNDDMKRNKDYFYKKHGL